ncbi:glycoside hydrolase family 27 protein [Fistulina hepatica ATCC 64428]|uniref:Alpha-galactosidase n=1 Tax=Fistulina hepatica ATCC 64428 TaxID=1128425 RepID=A0A0D7ABX7_9AGAR|nr:glycoside hydrolase family 27 protein [Fistulina hepatica ATCC 64428]
MELFLRVIALKWIIISWDVFRSWGIIRGMHIMWCDINETVVLENARLMVSLGLADVGYKYMNIDDCYSEKERNEEGDIVAHHGRFPSGMRAVTDEIHSLGLKAGIYSCAGWYTCQMYPGSFNNEERDAKLFQEDWGFDLLKYDNCAVPYDEILRDSMVGRFSRMSNALSALANSTGKPSMLYSLCQWGRAQPWLWARRISQTWRTTDDINDSWASVTSIINQNSFISWATDFYGHNDMDILEVGNGGLTYDEAKTHFTAWALMKSPLLIGTDLSRITDETLSILKNEELIAIHQDPVIGTGITPFRWLVNPDWTYDDAHPAALWSGESENGTVFMLLNSLDTAVNMTFTLNESPWVRTGRMYSVRDLWTHTDNGTVYRNMTVNVNSHGVVALLLKDVGDEPEGTLPPCATPEWCTDKNGTIL